MTIPGHKSYTKTERYAKSEDYFQKQLQKRRINMLDESESNLFEEYEQMVNARIDELNNKGFGATNKFREARNIHQIIRYLIENQPPIKKSLMRLAETLNIPFSAAKIISDHAQPEVDEKFIKKWTKAMIDVDNVITTEEEFIIALIKEIPVRIKED